MSTAGAWWGDPEPGPGLLDGVRFLRPDGSLYEPLAALGSRAGRAVPVPGGP